MAPSQDHRRCAEAVLREHRRRHRALGELKNREVRPPHFANTRCHGPDTNARHRQERGQGR